MTINPEIYLEMQQGPGCLARKFSKLIFRGRAQNISSFVLCLKWIKSNVYHAKFKPGIFRLRCMHARTEPTELSRKRVAKCPCVLYMVTKPSKCSSCIAKVFIATTTIFFKFCLTRNFGRLLFFLVMLRTFTSYNYYRNISRSENAFITVYTKAFNTIYR